jgi:hypothetical protein
VTSEGVVGIGAIVGVDVGGEVGVVAGVTGAETRTGAGSKVGVFFDARFLTRGVSNNVFPRRSSIAVRWESSSSRNGRSPWYVDLSADLR